MKDPVDEPSELNVFFFICLALIVGAIAAYKNRVPLIAKITGQPPTRVRRALEERKRRNA